MKSAALTAPADLTPARVQLLRELRARGYQFVTPTPETHARVLQRAAGRIDLREIFGWNRPFGDADLEPPLRRLLEACDGLERTGGAWRSKLRVSTIDDLYFLHSAFPTSEKDAVFFGPDSYRFANFLRRDLPRRSGLRVVDMGAGAGVGGLVAATLCAGASITLVDVNAAALDLARANALANGLEVEVRQQSDLRGICADVIVANPPYLMDDVSRTYRDGGGAHGEGLSLEWARQAAQQLPAQGEMLLYAGVAIVGGRDPLRAALAKLEGVALTYREVDPDVFGEELEKPAYRGVDRIAVVEAVIRKAAA